MDRERPRALRVLEGLPEPVLAAAALGGLGVVAAVDLLAPASLNLSVFYFVVIIWAAWFTNRRWGLALTVLAWAVAALVTVLSLRVGTSFGAEIWNQATLLGFDLVLWYLVAAMRDETARRDQLSLHDPMTEVSNRRALYADLGREIEQLRRFGRPFTLAYIDLDRFKAVNDELGHERGDRVLRGVARYLASHARAVDTVARVGGDEFAVLMPETDEQSATTAVERTRDGLNNFMCKAAPNATDVGATMGVIVFVKPPVSADQAVALADATMYAAKRERRGSLAIDRYGEGEAAPASAQADVP